MLLLLLQVKVWGFLLDYFQWIPCKEWKRKITIAESATTATLRNTCSHKKAKTEMIGKVETNQHGWSESQFEFASSSSRGINSKTTANIEPAGQSLRIQPPIQTLTSKLLTLFLIHLSQNSPNHSMQFTLIKVSQALKKMKTSRECWAD